MSIEDQLKAPFNPTAIHWRVGATNKKRWKEGQERKGIALAYIDARDVQDRFDDVCGINWQVRNPWSDGKKLACEIGIKVDDEWIWRGDGAGDTDVEGDKGAFSDSFKRAGVRFGIARYLYGLPNTWVTLDECWHLPKSEITNLTSRLAKWQTAKFGDKVTPDKKVDFDPTEGEQA